MVLAPPRKAAHARPDGLRGHDPDQGSGRARRCLEGARPRGDEAAHIPRPVATRAHLRGSAADRPPGVRLRLGSSGARAHRRRRGPTPRQLRGHVIAQTLGQQRAVALGVGDDAGASGGPVALAALLDRRGQVRGLHEPAAEGGDLDGGGHDLPVLGGQGHGHAAVVDKRGAPAGSLVGHGAGRGVEDERPGGGVGVGQAAQSGAAQEGEGVGAGGVGDGHDGSSPRMMSA